MRPCVLLMLLLKLTLSLLHGFPHGDDVVNGLECLVHYMDSRRNEIDLDAVFGLRMAEGQLRGLLANDSLLRHLPVTTTQKLNDMAYLINGIAVDTVSHLMEMDSSYLQRFSYVISQPWIFSSSPRQLHMSATHELSIEHDFDEQLYENFGEEQSDKCMAGLIGSLEDNSKKCSISDDCKAFVTNFKTKGYFLTHQILFYSLGKRLGCESLLVDLLTNKGLTMKEMEQQLCARVYSQMKMEMRDEGNDKDLFMECGAVCSPLGFYEVLPAQWIGAVLNWQEESGCYKVEELERETELVKFVAHNACCYHFCAVSRTNEQVTGRHILVDITLSDGCSSHMTGVAAGFLASSLYWLLAYPDLITDKTAGEKTIPLDVIHAIRTKLEDCGNKLTRVNTVSQVLIKLLILLLSVTGLVYFLRSRMFKKGRTWALRFLIGI